MKKVLFIIAAVSCLLSCRSVKNEGIIATHHYGMDADTLSIVSKSAKVDSTNYYHRVIDSLSRELKNVRQMYHNLYVRDSVSANQYHTDSEHVKDTTWMQVNADGSITYHHYREKQAYSYQQFESYRQQIVKDSKETIDSLIERNTYLQVQYDSISRFKSLADSLTIYKAKLNSISDALSEKEKKTVEKFSFWSRVKTVTGTIIFCTVAFIIVLVYFRFFRKK